MDRPGRKSGWLCVSLVSSVVLVGCDLFGPGSAKLAVEMDATSFTRVPPDANTPWAKSVAGPEFELH